MEEPINKFEICWNCQIDKGNSPIIKTKDGAEVTTKTQAVKNKNMSEV